MIKLVKLFGELNFSALFDIWAFKFKFPAHFDTWRTNLNSTAIFVMEEQKRKSAGKYKFTISYLICGLQKLGEKQSFEKHVLFIRSKF